MIPRSTIPLVLAAGLLLGGRGAGWGQISLGLYRNGQLVDVLAGSPVVGQNSSPAQPNARAKATSPLLPPPQAQSDVFVIAAQSALEIGAFLQQSQSVGLVGPAVERDRLALLLENFMTAQDAVRQSLWETEAQVVSLDLAPEIFDRHRETMDHFEVSLQTFSDSINAVLAGVPGSVESALALMQQLKFSQEPDLTRRGPTRLPQPPIPAPEITREQADALVHAGVTRLEDLLSAEADDIADIPQVGESASTILDAARAEAGRRSLSVGSAPVNR